MKVINMCLPIYESINLKLSFILVSYLRERQSKPLSLSILVIIDKSKNRVNLIGSSIWYDPISGISDRAEEYSHQPIWFNLDRLKHFSIQLNDKWTGSALLNPSISCREYEVVLKLYSFLCQSWFGNSLTAIRYCCFGNIFFR